MEVATVKKVWVLQRTFRIDDMERVVLLGVFKTSEEAVQHIDKAWTVTAKTAFEDSILFRTANQIFRADEIDFFDK